MYSTGFPGARVKHLPASVGDAGPVAGWGRSPGGGKGSLLQYSCLENSMSRRAWWAIVYGVAKNQTPLNERLSMHTCTHATDGVWAISEGESRPGMWGCQFL